MRFLSVLVLLLISCFGYIENSYAAGGDLVRSGKHGDIFEEAKSIFGKLENAELILIYNFKSGINVINREKEKSVIIGNATIHSNCTQSEYVRVSLLRWLLTSNVKSVWNNGSSIYFSGYKFRSDEGSGVEGLSGINVEKNLYFEDCTFDKLLAHDSVFSELIIANCYFEYFDVSGSTFKKRLRFIGNNELNDSSILIMESITANNNVYLNNIVAKGGLALPEAHIKGSLVVNSAKFGSVNATRLVVGGSVYWLARAGEDAVSNGLDMSGARIGGALEFGGVFGRGDREYAVDLSNAKIGGYLRSHRDAQYFGLVDLRQVDLKGFADFSGATFNSSAMALSAKNGDFGKDFVLSGCVVTGGVDVSGAKVADSFVARGGRFDGRGEGAIDASRINVAGDFDISSGFNATGSINMRGASIGQTVYAYNSTLSIEKGLALDMYGAKIGRDIDFSNDFKSNGTINLKNIAVDGSFIGSNSTFLETKNANATCAIGFEDSIVAHDIDLKLSRFIGIVKLDGATVSGDVIMSGVNVGTVDNFIDRTAVSARNLKCIGDVRLDDGFIVNGTMALQSAKISSELLIIESGGRNCTGLDLCGAHVGSFRDDMESWPPYHKLNIHDFKYDSLNMMSPYESEKRILWLNLANGEGVFEQPYMQLIKIYKDTGRSDDALSIYCELKSKHWTYQLSNFIAMITINYGKSEILCIVEFVLLLISGAYLFGRAMKKGRLVCDDLECCNGKYKNNDIDIVDENGNGSLNENGKVKIKVKEKKFNCLVYSFDALIPIVDFNHVKHWKFVRARDDNNPLEIWFFKIYKVDYYMMYQVFHSTAGWLLLSIYVARLLGLIG